MSMLLTAALMAVTSFFSFLTGLVLGCLAGLRTREQVPGADARRRASEALRSRSN